VEDALLWLIETNQSVRNYQRTKDLLCNLPCYKKVEKAKNEAYPEGITATEMGSSVPLESLLYHTAQRIIKTANLPGKFMINTHSW